MPALPVHTQTIHRRWTDADGEKVGLWMALGIIVTIIFFTLLLGAYNFILGNPFLKVNKLKQDFDAKRIEADDLEREVNQLKTSLQQTRNTLRTTTSQKDNAEAEERRLREGIETLRNDYELLRREHSDSVQEAESKETELVTLRRRVGDQQDANRNHLNRITTLECEMGKQKDKYKDLSKKYAAVQEEVALINIETASSILSE